MINADRVRRDVIVIGGSAGSVGPVRELLAKLPSDLPATLAVVLHRSPFYATQLPWLLGLRAVLRVVEPSDGDPVLGGVVYIAPRDHHVIFDDGVMRLTRGAKEHYTRPAIDPLFRSAAARYGSRVLGVLLSGMGADGVSGLIAIKRAGGLSLVQSPSEAQFPAMPCTALAEDDVDAALPIDELAPAIVQLARGETLEAARPRLTP
ncbi:MAG TPA: chemotaxis protein CheB [Methylomirabilota bacterium]|nr:chemotaxis protein CheB [Methylomirabilota bacterium]